MLFTECCDCREAEEAEAERLAQEEILKEKEARKEGMRKRKPVFTAKEKTDEELKGYSKLNLELNKGDGVKAATKVKSTKAVVSIACLEIKN